MPLGPWNKLYSMEIIRMNNIRFPSHWFGETLHFANTIAFYSQKIGVGHRKVYNYRLNNVNSGTTQYNVEYRLLSLDNAKKLRNACFSDNKRIKNAIEWHLYENYSTLIKNVVATKTETKYINEYKEAKLFLKRNWFAVFWNSEINTKSRIMIIFEAFIPKILALHRIRVQNKRLTEMCNVENK